jgi:hypothetical protein
MKAIAISSIILSVLCIGDAGRAQSTDVGATSAQVASVARTQAQVTGSALSEARGVQNSLLRGIPTGTPTAGVLPLSLKEAIDRGLRYNLGISLGEQGIRATQSSRLRALSALMPHLSVGTSESGTG